MKFVVFIGGVFGFALAATTGLLTGRGLDRVLFDAAVGTLVGGLLFRWLWNVLLSGVRENYLARQRAAAAASAAAASAKTAAAAVTARAGA
jgi:hypothetical protein